ncbi:hypothetical protein K474DRAFT_343294 [Panus rudis PR-1116 ss-1]|nr:hypothetical protein K474DRAFT_343294 [Panus rudis PR-1116 ss-1]
MSDIDSVERNDVGNISPQFNATDADVILRASDGMLFRVYRRDLEAFSEGFAGPAAAHDACPTNPADDIVQLTESSAVLEILLQFMRRQRHPSLKDLDGKTMAGVAEAVEKYQVFSALEACKTQMQEFVRSNPVDVLVYALRHDYEDLANLSVEYTLGLPLQRVYPRLPESYRLQWVSESDHY